MKCSICDSYIIIPDSTNRNISSEKYAIKYGDQYICIGCDEVKMFMDSTNQNIKTDEIKPKIIHEVNIIKQSTVCIKCKSEFSGPKCICGFENPLLMRKSKKKKKKK
tara:strand:- start:299 stop:619 length:321 start_codon:yes stop_codon:yes gene_type:complete